MNELNPVQIMILQMIEDALRTCGAYAAHTALQVANLSSALPHTTLIVWTGIVMMAYDAEKARFDDRRAAQLNYIVDGVAA